MSLAPSILALRNQSNNRIGSAFAHSIDSLLNEHESYCIGSVLMMSEVRFSDGCIESLPDESIAQLLASLSAEYDEAFVKKYGDGNLEAISEDKRRSYWLAKIAEWRAEDTPLTYSDRNTIQRLESAFLKQPTVDRIQLRK